MNKKETELRFSSIDLVKKEKIKKLEKLNIGPAQKADIMLVVLGYKAATELDLYEYNTPVGEVKKVLADISLQVQDKKIPSHQQNVVAKLAIASNEENLDKLMKLDPSRDHTEYGQLMGYPQTAIDAFVNEKLLADKDYPDMTGIIFNMKFSQEHWPDELKILKEWSEAIRKYSPETYDSLKGE